MATQNPTQWEKFKKINLWRFLAWVLGIFFFIFGFVTLFLHPLQGLILLLMSAILLPPIARLISQKSKRTFSRKIRVGTLFVLGIVFLVTLPPSAGQSVAISTNPPASVAVVVPATDEQKIGDAVKSVIDQNTDSGWATHTGVKIQDESAPFPQGTKFVWIDIATDPSGLWDDTAQLTQSGVLTTKILQQVFPISDKFDDVLVSYNGKVVDAYGNAKDSQLISYNVDRPLYYKINWQNFSDTQNDIHFCAFLREEFNTMSQAQQDNSVVGCGVLPRDLRQAEDAIETGNSQYRDIPQHGI